MNILLLYEPETEALSALTVAQVHHCVSLIGIHAEQSTNPDEQKTLTFDVRDADVVVVRLESPPPEQWLKLLAEMKRLKPDLQIWYIPSPKSHEDEFTWSAKINPTRIVPRHSLKQALDTLVARTFPASH